MDHTGRAYLSEHRAVPRASRDTPEEACAQVRGAAASVLLDLYWAGRPVMTGWPALLGIGEPGCPARIVYGLRMRTEFIYC
jgi:hypothetical protein